MPTIALDDIPQAIQGPSAWRGPDLAARRDWIEHLSDAAIAAQRFGVEYWRAEAVVDTVVTRT